MSELKSVITDFKTAMRFVKPLAKIVEHLELLEGLEQREIGLRHTISILESRKSVLGTDISTAGDALSTKQRNCREEIKKINDGIGVEKQAELDIWEGKLSTSKEACELSEQQRGNLIKENKSLEAERSKLKTEVINLRKVLINANLVVEGGS